MNKKIVSLLLFLMILGGCGKKQQKAGYNKRKLSTNEPLAHVSIPMGGAESDSFFDENVSEFNLADNADYTWADDDDDTGRLSAIYFDFDRHEVKADQESRLADNIGTIKQELAAARKRGEMPTIVIEGHACHAAGSSVYNVAKSEKRAKSISDRLLAAGIPREAIKIVGRGKEVPAVIDGKIVTGDRSQQWPNRRGELRIIYG